MRVNQVPSMIELGRFGRNEAHILIGALAAQGIPAVALDANASIADGSDLFIPTRVMIDDDDAAAARAILTAAAR